MFRREGPFQRGFAIQAAFDGFAGIDVPGRFDRLDPQQSFQHAVLPDDRIGRAASTLPAAWNRESRANGPLYLSQS
ncbi:hypothetical protein D3C86_2211190 [compost metagenome]